MKKYIITAVGFLWAGSFSVFSQSLSINTDGSTANASAMLDVKSTVKGLLIPRMTSAQRTAIGSPAIGLQVYDTDLNLLYFYNGSTWAGLSASTNFWTLSGGNIYNNTGTNVGIGTTTPGRTLDVNGDIRSTTQMLIGPGTNKTLWFNTDISTLTIAKVIFEFDGTNNNLHSQILNGNSIETAGITLSQGAYITLQTANDPLNPTGTFERLRITNNGNVGIGAVSPAEKLEITGNLKFTGASSIYSGTGTALTIRPGDGTGNGGVLTIRGGNAGIPSGGAGGDLNLNAGANMVSGGSGYGGLGVPGKVNITGSPGYNSVGGDINIIAGATSCWSLVVGSHSDVNIKGGTNLVAAAIASISVQGGYTIGSSCPTPNETGGNLIFQSGLGSGTGTNGNIQLLNGNVGIGTAAPSSKLEVCGNVRVIGTIVASGSITTSAIACPSDFRYKKNITPLSNSLQKLMRMEGVNYYWKTSDFPAMNFNNKMQMGFIAQDVEKIFPEMVFTDDAGYKSIDYSRLTPVLVETIKVQQKQINELFKRVEILEKNNH